MTTETTTDEVTTTTTEVLYYAYDASGSPLSLTLTDESGAESTYYYAVTVQGDVAAILTTSGAVVVEYTYDAWGNPLAVTGTLSDTLGETNSLRYRGYVYDSEIGYYYLQTRYYNPELGRFINADAYASTGQGLIGNNMFAYCGNNPVNYSDPTGFRFMPPIDFYDTLVDEIGKIISELTPVYENLSESTQLDGPLPFVDYAALIGVVAITGYAVITGTITAIKTTKADEAKEHAFADAAVLLNKTKGQAYFTLDPLQFRPIGLIPVIYKGSYNGKIIMWKDPITGVAIFEWDEDLKYGSHYHIGAHDGTHFPPGSPVPEPWNSMYFGG